MSVDDWFGSGKSEEIDMAAEQFIRGLKKKKPVYDNIFDWLKGRITNQQSIPNESSTLSKLEAKLARDPDNEYIKEAIRNQKGK